VLNPKQSEITSSHSHSYNKTNSQSPNISDDTIIAGIDQSFSHTAMCIGSKKLGVTKTRSIISDKKETNENRIVFIKNSILQIIKENDIKHINIEGLSFASSQASNRQLAGLFYVILVSLLESGITYSIIPPKSLKKQVTDNGNAGKKDMINAIKERELEKLQKLSNISKDSKKFEDIADAYHLFNYFMI